MIDMPLIRPTKKKKKRKEKEELGEIF